VPWRGTIPVWLFCRGYCGPPLRRLPPGPSWTRRPSFPGLPQGPCGHRPVAAPKAFPPPPAQGPPGRSHLYTCGPSPRAGTSGARGSTPGWGETQSAGRPTLVAPPGPASVDTPHRIFAPPTGFSDPATGQRAPRLSPLVLQTPASPPRPAAPVLSPALPLSPRPGPGRPPASSCR